MPGPVCASIAAFFLCCLCSGFLWINFSFYDPGLGISAAARNFNCPEAADRFRGTAGGQRGTSSCGSALILELVLMIRDCDGASGWCRQTDRRREQAPVFGADGAV